MYDKGKISKSLLTAYPHSQGLDYIQSMKNWREVMFERETFSVQLTDPMLYDRLHTLSAEYSVSVEVLVNAAVKRLVDDVDFVRSLRTGKTEGA